MPPRTPHRLPPEPPPAIIEAFRKRLSARDLSALSMVFALRMTAQQVDNAVTEWMAGTVGSPARFQILAVLWASAERGVPHKEIVAALGVTRATVSELMAALERDGFVTSSVDSDDRRNLIANLTTRGRTIIEKAVEANATRLRGAFAPLSADDLKTIATLLQRIRQGFAASAGKDDQPRAKHPSPNSLPQEEGASSSRPVPPLGGGRDVGAAARPAGEGQRGSRASRLGVSPAPDGRSPTSARSRGRSR